MKFYFFIIPVIVLASCGNRTLPADSEENTTSTCSSSVSANNEENSLCGLYICSETGDMLRFYEDKSGIFRTGGIKPQNASFEWTRTDAEVDLKFIGDAESFGTQNLIYSEIKDELYESSSSLGTIVYRKSKKI